MGFTHPQPGPTFALPPGGSACLSTSFGKARGAEAVSLDVGWMEEELAFVSPSCVVGFQPRPCCSSWLFLRPGAGL